MCAWEESCNGQTGKNSCNIVFNKPHPRSNNGATQSHDVSLTSTLKTVWPMGIGGGGGGEGGGGEGGGGGR